MANYLFTCQINEDSIQVLKFQLAKGGSRALVDLSFEPSGEIGDDNAQGAKLERALKGLGYSAHPIIISLPRKNATCRFLKVPAETEQEIENIVNLQSSRYLPYPAEELVSAFSRVSTDKTGYSEISIAIVHRDIIERCLKIFKGTKAAKLTIALSSYGLTNIYARLKGISYEPVMIMDINSGQVELGFVSHNKLLFSRCFKANTALADWESQFSDEIKKSGDAYARETSLALPKKISVIDPDGKNREFVSALNKISGVEVEILNYDQIWLSRDTRDKILKSGLSWAAPLGLGVIAIEDSLNILPASVKEEFRKSSKERQKIKLALRILGIAVIFGLGLAKGIDNKSNYLKSLKNQLAKIAPEARPLEEMDKRIKFLKGRGRGRVSGLDVLYELHKTIAPEIKLISLNYEDKGPVILRGQANSLNSVFSFTAALEKSPVFKNYLPKVRYATKKNTQAGEVIDFEISCAKK